MMAARSPYNGEILGSIAGLNGDIWVTVQMSLLRPARARPPSSEWVRGLSW